MRIAVRSVLGPALVIALAVAGPATAETATASASFPHTIEAFTMHPETRWRLFTDGVMGGISTAELVFIEGDGAPYARMTGTVSTANRGGFIQMRRDLDRPPPERAAGVRLVVRGNNQRYFVHLRTRGTVLPWQYYQAGFDVTRDWQEIRVPFSAFRASGKMLRAVPRPGDVRSVALVAFGRDHQAEVEMREIGFYEQP
ncbi:NADH ubiquinone oxidoreductase [Rhodobacter sp. TJ_12]|uniref:CIA30 family protein n=1 Tax=Rhodobacter sp. TJ_12 TaxID=2029399 RepID=UPI001CBB8D21|nr:CIA30 family protein [Rhodobacter sp. TJ_12]MBZ4021471.1 NADH ubiquinone oxidoreductase [Rhodobacter sp. TJ_12]